MAEGEVPPRPPEIPPPPPGDREMPPAEPPREPPDSPERPDTETTEERESEESRDILPDDSRTLSFRAQHRDEVVDLYDKARRLIGVGTPIAGIAQETIEREVREEYADVIAEGHMSQSAIDEEIRQHSEVVRQFIYDSFSEVFNTDDPQELRRNLAHFESQLQRLVQDKLLEQDKQKDIFHTVEKVYELEKEALRHGETRDMMTVLEEARHASGIKFTDEQIKLQIAMKDVKKFKELIVEKYTEDDGGVNWPELSKDIRDVFEEILQVAETKPLDFFQDAFIEFYEGQIYKQRINDLRQLGLQVATDEDLKGRSVMVSDTTYRPDILQEGPGGKQRMAYRGEVRFNLSDALGSVMVQRMTTLRNFGGEYLHNVNAILHVGLGWETMHQQSERVGTADMDWMFYEDPDLCEAYRLYFSTLSKELGVNKHIVPDDFGDPDNQKLDFAQRTVYMQLLARKERPTGDDADITWEKIKQRARLTARRASALAKGATTEFWGAALTAKMPNTHRKAWKPVFDERGRPVMETITDPETGEQIERHKHTEVLEFNPTFVSHQQGGHERMVGGLDPDQTYFRFGLPAFYKKFRYTYAPRNPGEGVNPYNMTEPFAGYFYNPAIVGKVSEWVESSHFEGRTDDQADFDEKYKIFCESLNLPSVDYMFREGWRFNEYKAFLEAGIPGNPDAIRFEESIDNIKQIGFKLIRAFIRDQEGYPWRREPGGKSRMHMKGKTIKGLFKDEDALKARDFKDEEYYSFGRLPEELRDIFEEKVYEKYIFQRITDQRPSWWFGLEMPRISPKGEVFIVDTMTDWLKQNIRGVPGLEDLRADFVEKDVLNLFITSLDMVENMHWDDGRADSEKRRSMINGEERKLTAADLDRYRPQIMEYFALYKDAIVQGTDRGADLNLNSLNPDQFFELLKGFTGQLRHEVDNEGEDGYQRWSRTKHQDKYEETLAKRYGHAMELGLGRLDYLIGGGDFDWGTYLSQQSGKRTAARAIREGHVVESQMIPAFGKLIFERYPQFILNAAGKSPEEFEKLTKELIATGIREIANPYGQEIDPKRAQQFAGELYLFLDKGMAEPRYFREKIIGPLFKLIARTNRGTQASLMQEFFTNQIDRPTFSSNSDTSYHMLRVVANENNIPFQKFGEVAYHKEIRTVFSRIVEAATFGKVRPRKKIPVFKKHANSVEDLRKGAGNGPGSRFIESFAPVIGSIIALILALQVWNAMKATTEKR